MSKTYKPNKIEKLDVVIMSKEDKFWTDVADKTSKEIESMEQMIIFNKEIMQLAKSKLSKPAGDSPNN